MYLRHGAFSYLPDLTDAEIGAQVRYALLNNWPVSIEYTDDPHPRNAYWEMWGLPLFDLDEPDGVLAEINACRATFPRHYVRVLAYDASYGRQTTALSFLVQRPPDEPGFALNRVEGSDRRQRYSLHSYAAEARSGARYAD
ncbi:ribulose bisphosphate carboxylase small subunit [Nocardia cyriacigeorgica]|jgi:ribulose-bisphosphate carboxylase small chain|uniref:ribulose bisphosphate carboxylase small subunit n=1 Tax=Nocardia cyriacigeorgica TaxID=135487 RepID=UPI00030509E7|nr:ribulose bisphosphate carboxylase small subunit [Nocardia cyriacigeorgica]AVH23397.1 ribulose bisphosphate carboxylase small subunit [Nocardia cyriacigeorgica]MBF6088231.1 ribulose bisphosphate carboxylase small subunit [Nocardia cyriacigeorgica]MBF6095341.1 ribulose bisphosphate carboxylase small subunit [Nocardia cyriacigeorgica]MBF6322963.1 ribulose bisphosphate carboxylase small subunit [Nocardia cyriacigeorgica]MBF6497333.1 ribulose bisphosphate carboxylase small subunit [Nocardia cyri